MTRVALITGGTTPERSVALSGAGKVVEALRDEGFDVVVIDTCSGVLSRSQEVELLEELVGREPPSQSELERLRAREDLAGVVASDAVREADVVFPVLHGREGEGGALQLLLELANATFVGSDARGSGLAMDKDTAKRLMVQAGIPTADWELAPVSPSRLSELGVPVIVKPSRVGSTVGLTFVETRTQLPAAIARARAFDSDVLVERVLPGRELTVGVLGGDALEVGEIVVTGGVFDFESKYTAGIASEQFPAPIESDLRERLRDLALEVHLTLRLRDFSRVDFRLDDEGRPSCLEANTLPGMTPTSLLPQSAAAMGIDFRELCRRLVELALERANQVASGSAAS